MTGYVETNVLFSPSYHIADKLARKKSLSRKLIQRPEKEKLVGRNILFRRTEEERRLDRSNVGDKLTRKLSLRPTSGELEDRNILKSK